MAVHRVHLQDLRLQGIMVLEAGLAMPSLVDAVPAPAVVLFLLETWGLRFQAALLGSLQCPSHKKLEVIHQKRPPGGV